MTFTTAQRTIGKDNGIGDIFLADVQYDDGNTGSIIVYGGNLQMTSSLLNSFSKIWNFKVTAVS